MTKLTAIVAGLLACIVATPALATTYYYTGADYTHTITVGQTIPAPPWSAEEFATQQWGMQGDRTTATIIFESDMSAFSGTLVVRKYDPSIDGPSHAPTNAISWEWYSGSITMQFVLTTVTFDHGEIVAWSTAGSGGVPFINRSLVIGCNCQNLDFRSNSSSGELLDIKNGFLGWRSGAFTTEPGTWTRIDAVPAPIIGGGLPGLLLASLGWLGWRRRRQ
jgi:hypothetical protein